MSKKLLMSFMLALGMLLLAGCDNDDDPPPPVTLTGISISPAQVTDGLPIGVTRQFTATGNYSDSSVQDHTASVTWSSSVPATASVDGNGLATGHAVGAADITAAEQGLTSNAVALDVINPTLLSITVAPASVPDPLMLGRSQQFQAEGTFNNNATHDITSMVTWDSSEVFASIDQTGLATAASPGTTNISASTATPALVSNLVALTADVLVEAELIIEPQNPAALPIDRQQQFVAFLKFTNGSVLNVTDSALWTSSDDNVADVNTSSGNVIGKGVGTATITATDSITNLQDEFDLEVNDATLETVTVTPENPAGLPIGNTQAFVAKGTFSDGVTRILRGLDSWSVSDSSIASMDFLSLTEGIALVTGLVEGDVNVVYSDYAVGGTPTGKEGFSSLTVTAAVMQSMTIYPNTAQSVAAGNSKHFTAQGVYGDGTERDVTNDAIWNSTATDVGVFDVETKGKLTVLPGATPAATTDASASLQRPDDTVIFSPTVVVTVNSDMLASLQITPTNAKAVIGSATQLSAMATFTPSGELIDFTDRVTWSSDDTGIVTVSNAAGTEGQITGVSVGTATVRAVDPATGINTNTSVSVSQE